MQNDQSKIRELENAIRLLKGEKIKPNFNPNKNDRTSDLERNDDDDDDIPSNRSTKNRDNAKKPRRKKKDIKIDRVEFCAVDSDQLDATFENKGTRSVVIQEIQFNRDNIQFVIERYYSSEYGKTVEGKIPPSYEGRMFGPNLIAFILASYYEGDVTIKKIQKIFRNKKGSGEI